ncbi:uncharacterized protein [Ptychodera flava]|uniref:uncharacterized protein n=1 Tax=Ptychodera flava TaxID=63121 RepID=UPI003969F102
MGKRKDSDATATGGGRRGRRRRFKGITEYNSTYKVHDITAKRDGIRPVGNLVSNAGTMEDTTVQRQDYVTHPIEKVQPVRRSGQIKAQDGEMDLRTSYDSDFTGKKATPVKFIKPSDAILVKTPPKFNANPTYRDDYQEWVVSKREVAKAPDEYIPPTQPLQNETTFKTEFQPKTVAPRKSKKPVQELAKSDQPMEDKSSHQLDYITHPLPPRFKKEKEVYRMSSSKVETMTTSRRDYTPKKDGKQKSCKPIENPVNDGQPFDDATTAKTDFQKWEVKLPVLHQPERYIKPVGEIDTLTTSRRDFPPRKTERVVVVKRQDHDIVEVGPFHDVTNYKQDYKKWEEHVPERGMDPSRKPYEKPTQTFGGATNYQADYHKKDLSPRENYAPKPKERESGEFYGSTGYKDEFIARKVSGKVQKTRKLSDHYKVRTVLPKIESMTTQKHDYTTKELTKTRSCKPPQEPLNTKEPFDDKTTCKQDYKQWVVELPKLHQAEIYIKPPGKMDLQTTMQKDFPPRKAEKVSLMKPPSNTVDHAVPFHGMTSYNNSYQPYEGHVPEKGANPSKKPYQKPEEVFTTTTSYGDNFERKVTTRRQAIRPKEMTKDTNEAFESHTIYRNEFLPRKTQKRSPINPLKYSNYIMDYIDDSEDDSDVVTKSSAVATEKAFKTPPTTTQIAAVV